MISSLKTTVSESSNYILQVTQNFYFHVSDLETKMAVKQGAEVL